MSNNNSSTYHSVCSFFQSAFIALTFLLISGCANTNAYNPRDPFENFNRHTYRMNDKLDKVIMKPIATGYKKIMPPLLSKCIYSFFSNLNEVPTVINDVLQLHPKMALHDTGRFLINSTVGLLGLFDMATPMGIPHNEQDFGQTLARWGYTHSRYFVIPLLGPSTIRDTISRPIDYHMFSVMPYIDPAKTRNRLIATDYISRRTALLGTEKVLAESFDPYAFMRDAYLQKRDQLIAEKRGKQIADARTHVNNAKRPQPALLHRGNQPSLKHDQDTFVPAVE